MMNRFLFLTVICIVVGILTCSVVSPVTAATPAAFMKTDTMAAQLQEETDDQGEEPSDNEPIEINYGEETTRQIFGILVVVLVLAVVFELALTPIFKWSIFIKHFLGHGIRTPITIGLALATFWAFDIDIFRDLMNAMATEGTEVPVSFWGKVLTALLIAGGSGTVYEIFNRLGIQNYGERVEEVIDEEIRSGEGSKESTVPGESPDPMTQQENQLQPL